MLQLQNVTKTYKTKAGVVNALDGVSITFPATGLVFITGKSGCGKTTLLNVIGGLDGIDGGEILIQDKKFSTFSATEYDSYRNTFIGFIFQEYNLLNEFTVEQNIKIAMELQGRKADEAEFEKLLQDVEISEFKDRNPSELSGGQRQRVAIARALVKQPRIIMADEPTGALDSGTGIQVLDTLKELSKDKLVIVVSHDREFAEKYADRIIQLVDGKVAQDITFTEKSLATNVSEQENALVVREGADLSESEKDLLAKAVKERKKIEIIENLSYRDKEPTGDVEHTVDKPVSLKKSKMKFKRAAFLGVKSLAVKPFRLILTILVSAIAFAVFALFDTIANFNTVSVLKNTLRASSAQSVTTKASYIVDFEAGDEYALQVSEKVLADLEKETKGAVKGIFNFRENATGNVVHTLPISELKSSGVIIGTKYYSQAINGFIEFNVDNEIQTDGTFKDFPYQVISGRYPKIVYSGSLFDKSLHEVAISTHLADSILYYLNGKKLNDKTIKKHKDLLNATLTVDNVKYTIVGIVDCGQIPEKYDILKQSTPYNLTTNSLLNDYNAYINAGAQNCLFVADGFKDGWKDINKSANVSYIGNMDWSLKTEGSSTKKSPTDYVYNANDYDENNILLFKERESGDVSLSDDEILIHHLNLENLFAFEIAGLSEKEPSEKERARDLIRNMNLRNTAQNRTALNELLVLLNKDLSSGYISATLNQRYTKTDVNTSTDVKIVGVYFGIETSSYTSPSRYQFMMNDKLMQTLNIYPHQGDYNKILFSPAALRSGLNTIVNYVISETGLALQLYNNSALSIIQENEPIIKQVANLFLYVAIALALLSVFMLYNYISTSIANKKQSVGVLRGLGAGGKDILLTFLSESLVISIVNGILANAFASLGCLLVNSYIVNIMNVSIHFALFGARQILIIAAISLLTAILSSALPIVKISKKKPVELIRR